MVKMHKIHYLFATAHTRAHRVKPAQPVEPKSNTPTLLLEGPRRLVINKLEPIFYSAKANHFINLQKLYIINLLTAKKRCERVAAICSKI